MSLTTRTLRLGAVALTAISLAGVSACSISLGGSEPEAATTQEASPSPETPTAPETTRAPAPTSEPATDSTTAQASQPVAAGSSSGERPGANATITDDDWLLLLDRVDKTISAGSGTVLISENNGYIKIDGDVTTLTITGSNNDVVVDYADTVVIEGGNTTVYVRDVNKVVFHGANGEVVWAGNTPVINDFGTNTETRRQDQDD